MKHFRLILVLTLISCLVLISCRSKQEKTEEKEKAKQYVQFARLPYCPTSDLKNDSCGVCKIVAKKGFKVAHVENNNKNNIDFNMIVSANNEGEVVISFGGPKSENVEYFQQIYASGLSKVSKLNNLLIENEFWKVYSSFFRENLLSKIGELSKKASKIVFVGHSFGGSMAMIAAYDVVYSNIIEKNNKIGPFIYTFGALKIGVHDFAQNVQTFIGIPMIRLRRFYDFYTWIPRCVFIHALDIWHCYSSYPYLVTAYPMFAAYYSMYSPIIRRHLVAHVPKIVQNAETYLNKPVISENVQKVPHQKAKENSKSETTDSPATLSGTKPSPSGIKPSPSGTEPIPSTAQPSKDTKEPTLHNLKTEGKVRHTELNTLLNDHHSGKHSHKNFIDNVSNMFSHHTKSEIPKEKLASDTPMTYSGLKIDDEEMKRRNRAPSNNLQQNQLSSSNMLNQFSSSTPVSYNGLHASSISNSNNISGVSHSVSHSSGIHDRKNFPSFIERRGDVFEGKNFLEKCESKGHYVSCKFAPNIHKEYFGIDIESCD